MDILKILSQFQNSEVTNQIASNANVKPDAVGKVLELGIPTLLSALGTNTQSNKGAESLSNALDKHTGSAINDVSGFIKTVDVNDGAKILKNILGSKQVPVQQSIADTAGISATAVGSILSQFAPLLLGFLGQQKQDNGLDASGIASLIPTLLASVGKAGGSDLIGMATSLLGGSSGDLLNNVGDLIGDLFGDKK